MVPEQHIVLQNYTDMSKWEELLFQHRWPFSPLTTNVLSHLIISNCAKSQGILKSD